MQQEARQRLIFVIPAKAGIRFSGFTEKADAAAAKAESGISAFAEMTGK